MQRFQSKDIADLDKRYRTNLVNSLSGFKSVNLIGTVDAEGTTNVSVFSSVIHLGANPALMGFIMRPVSVTRDTYNNIMATGHYTFNHITADFFGKAHQSSARYPANISEFAAVDLTAQYKDDFPAPYVAESPIQIGLEFREQMEIQLNGTILMIGAVKELYVPEDCLQADGYLDIEKAGTITVSGLDAYHTTRKLARLSYAKADRALRALEGKLK
ncbi:flavin reductase family protein [Flavilitoribacter nigricans]|uniref:Flavin oxidoreductase n=1 Tax=Flavilitoribacter nigricans (strain ATCC 23147 / DSM 23189 / NBRC 102662 / NCIMB 1420 / SS-2) TaxID=1122177 RepID=A0A2D0N2C3_FLAN2|nr:flavin reductase [Flavilitoribacter nigricans]PHN02654.1 flavin oxidoreductase [Flavilitoribacter nigricans DSM 23189 = NBRC 102662]